MALKWRRTNKTDGYESTDGKWVIEHQMAYTNCEAAHPMRNGGYHDGGEEHEYMLWVLWREDINGERVDAGPTLRGMKAAAEEEEEEEEG